MGVPWYYPLVKRTFDIVTSTVALGVLAVPIGVCCAAVKLQSPGPAIIRQRRIGQWGKPIDIYKIRSMVTDAADVEKYFTPEQLEQWKAEQKVDNDPRVTPVGRFLRKTSLDETPQFLNVLEGSMSVVGPRPVTKGELSWYGTDVDELLSVKPGITGYWQVYARNDATYIDGVRQSMELYYVRNRSVRLDLKIVLATFRVIIRGTGK